MDLKDERERLIDDIVPLPDPTIETYRHMLEAYAQQFDSQPEFRAIVVLNALWTAAEFESRDQTRALDTMVPAPLWCLVFVAEAWKKYSEQHKAGNPVTFSMALGLDRIGRGSRPAMSQFALQTRDQRIAVWIAEKARRGQMLKNLFADVASLHNITEHSVRQIWKKWGAKARRQLAIYRARTGQ